MESCHPSRIKSRCFLLDQVYGQDPWMGSLDKFLRQTSWTISLDGFFGEGLLSHQCFLGNLSCIHTLLKIVKKCPFLGKKPPEFCAKLEEGDLGFFQIFFVAPPNRNHFPPILEFPKKYLFSLSVSRFHSFTPCIWCI